DTILAAVSGATHSGLEDGKHITAAEQLAIFLYLGRAGASNRDLQERFQHSGDTISKYIHLLLEKCCGSFYQKFVCPPPDQMPYEIHSNPKLYPYFKNTRCSLNGSHFNQYCTVESVACNWNRKGGVTQNVLCACDFNLKFTYVCSGWEGSGSDGMVYESAHGIDFAIKPGTYYLADAGFPLCHALLTPYRGKQYHLREPKDREELFNLRHAQAHNVVEHIFGIFKATCLTDNWS
ncbi:hypothetical protein MPER_10689, partial [Moniliophthora perniciosa FA553]